MKKLPIILYFICSSFFSKAQNGISILEGPGPYNMNCNDSCLTLHANFPKPLKTTQYSISSTPFAPLTITGTPIILGDDEFSTAIPLGFNFCFFQNTYTQCYIADNGVLTFDNAYSGGVCNNNAQQLLPYFNSTFPDNAIFFMYMDINPTLGGSIKYATIGTAPFRKFVVDYQNMKIFGNTCSNTSSSFQVVLSETTNLIEVFLTNKVTCDNNPNLYSNYGTIGIQDIGSTVQYTAAGKHAAMFTSSNEGIKIAPSGPIDYSVKWYNASNTIIAGNVDSIYFCPPYFPYSQIKAEITINCPNAKFKDSITITKSIPKFDSVIIVKPMCNGDSSGSITAYAHTSAPPLTFSINNSTPQSSNSFSNLWTGNYLLSAIDANGCKKDTIIPLLPLYSISIIMDSIIKPTCPDSNGIMYVHCVNGSAPYTITWSNGDTGMMADSLAAGPLTAYVVDANGCTQMLQYTIPFGGLPNIVTTVTKPICGDSSGSISTVVSGGTAPYSYVWSTGSSNSSIQNIPAGYYTVTVSDVNLCTKVISYIIIDTLKTLTMNTVTNTTCGLANGSIFHTSYNAVAPYTYLWQPGGATTPSLNNVASGNYTCTTTDANGCVKIDTIHVNASLGLVNSISKANANCDSANGIIYLNSVSNNVGTVIIQWSTGASGNVINNLAPGVYWVKTNDLSSGCSKTDTIILTNDGKPKLGIVSFTQPNCFGDSSGSVTLTGSGGTSPYKYSLDGITFTSFAQINNIPGGIYTIYLTDANSCLNDTIVNFPQPSIIILSSTLDTIICFDDLNASINVSASGGFAPYQFAFNNGAFSSTTSFSNLGQGSYPVTVLDSHNCTQSSVITIAGPSAPLEIVMNKKDIPCFEKNTGSVTATIQGGWPPYQYTWSNGAVALSQSFLGESNLALHVVDVKGCNVNTPVDIVQLKCCKLVIPNAFTPNGDHVNDELKLLPISEIKDVKLLIYNRWGKQVFATRDLLQTWDGKFNGHDCDVDVYYYYLEYSCPFQTEKVIEKGDITLIR